LSSIQATRPRRERENHQGRETASRENSTSSIAPTGFKRHDGRRSDQGNCSSRVNVEELGVELREAHEG